MQVRSHIRRKSRKIFPIYLATLFVSFHYAAVIYIGSSNLERFFSKDIVSLLFILGATINIFLFVLTPKILKKMSDRTLLFAFILLEILAVFGLAISHSPTTIAFMFLIHESVVPMIYYCLDLFLEDATPENETGEVRGIDLTVVNIAIACGPLLVSFLTPDGDFSLLYFASTLLLVPMLFVVFFSFRKLKIEPPKLGKSVFEFKLWLKSIDIRRVTIARLILQIFYAVMVIYTPIYLHNTMMFSWSQIGLIFTVMLLPFILFELPAEEVAEHWSGEKEVMTVGFFIMGMSLLIMPFLSANIFSWMIVLFVSRIGASFVEVTTEAYFFKRVWKTDTGLISIFRITAPVSIVLGSMLGVIVLSLLPFKAIFLVLSILVFFGTQMSAILKEVR